MSELIEVLKDIHEELRMANILKLKKIGSKRRLDVRCPVEDDDMGSIYAHTRTYVKKLEIDPAKNLKKKDK